MRNLRGKGRVLDMFAVVEGCEIVFEVTDLMYNSRVFPMVKLSFQPVMKRIKS
jgi:hypothetical protein